MSGIPQRAFAGLPEKVEEAARAVSERLAAAQVPHAVIGAVACNAHKHARATQDVDVLVNKDDLPCVSEALCGHGWVAKFPGARRRFRDSARGVDVDVLVSGEFPGDGQPKPVAFPQIADGTRKGERPLDVDGVKVLALVPLVELKLASGMSLECRLKDLADVQALIDANDLPREFVHELHVSVKPTFVRLWEQVQHGRKSGMS
jgi:hypothetical protein